MPQPAKPNTKVNSDDSSDSEDIDSESNCSCSDSYGDSDWDDEAPGFEGLETWSNPQQIIQKALTGW